LYVRLYHGQETLGLQPEHCLKLTLEELPTWV
jgi:hypothetical protein